MSSPVHCCVGPQAFKSVLGALLSCVIGCGPAGGLTVQGPAKYTREDFVVRFQGAQRREVIGTLGPPDFVIEPDEKNREHWQYASVTYNPATGLADESVDLAISSDVVESGRTVAGIKFVSPRSFPGSK